MAVPWFTNDHRSRSNRYTRSIPWEKAISGYLTTHLIFLDESFKAIMS